MARLAKCSCESTADIYDNGLEIFIQCTNARCGKETTTYRYTKLTKKDSERQAIAEWNQQAVQEVIRQKQLFK